MTTDLEKAARHQARLEPLPPTLFFARSRGSVVALSIAAPGVLQVQTAANGPWQRYRVEGIGRGIRPWFLRVRLSGEDRKLKLWMHLPGRRGRLDVGRNDSGGGLAGPGFFSGGSGDDILSTIISAIEMVIFLIYLVFLLVALPFVAVEMVRRRRVARAFRCLLVPS